MSFNSNLHRLRLQILAHINKCTKIIGNFKIFLHIHLHHIIPEIRITSLVIAGTLMRQHNFRIQTQIMFTCKTTDGAHLRIRLKTILTHKATYVFSFRVLFKPSSFPDRPEVYISHIIIYIIIAGHRRCRVIIPRFIHSLYRFRNYVIKEFMQITLINSVFFGRITIFPSPSEI